MPANRNLMRRRDVFDNTRREEPRGNLNLAEVFNVLNQCANGTPPPKEAMHNAMHTVLGEIAKEKRARAARTLPPQQPVDVQYPRAGRAIEMERGADGDFVAPEEPAVNAPAPVADDAARTVEGEDGMREIMNELHVPLRVRPTATRILNNVVANPDGTFSSADGSLDISDIDKLKMMMARTLQEIYAEIGRTGQYNVDIDEGLNAHVITRDAAGRRKEITIEPQVENA